MSAVGMSKTEAGFRFALFAATAASEASSRRHRVAWKLHLHLELGGGFGSRPFCQGEAYV